MAQYSVQEDKLLAYTRQMISYALKNHKAELVALLNGNGIDVPANVDSTTLHVMVLTAMTNSATFRDDLVELLYTIAMEGQYAKFTGPSDFANQDGTGSQSSSGSWFSEVFDPSTVKGLLSTGILIINDNISKNGNNAIQSEVKATQTPQPIKPFPWAAVIASCALASLVIYGVYKYSTSNVQS